MDFHAAFDNVNIFACKPCVFQMEGPISESNAQFSSNLFGSLGVGVFVGPNTIDFKTLFDNVDEKILDNAAVFVTVLLLMVAFIPVAAVCAKFDRLDALKVWRVILFCAIQSI